MDFEEEGRDIPPHFQRQAEVWSCISAGLRIIFICRDIREARLNTNSDELGLSGYFSGDLDMKMV